MKLARVLGAFFLLVSMAPGQNAQEQDMPIIDMHLHAVPVDFLPDEFAFPGLAKPATDEALMRESLAAMERYNIVKAVASGPLEVAKQWKAAAPDRIIVAPLFPHFAPAPELGQLRADIKAGRVEVLGEITAQYAGLAMNAPELEPYYALAAELDIPVAIHTGLGPRGISYSECCPEFRAAAGNPMLLEDVLRRHPNLRVYLMHAGGPYLEETIAILHLYPQVHADLAVINWVWNRPRFHRYLQRLIEAGLAKQLMFGSDQMVWPETIGKAIEAIESADFLTENQKRDIFYNNAARFLRLDEKRSQH